MIRKSGKIKNQPAGYKAFIPSPLPPRPPLKLKAPLAQLLSEADMAIGRLDTMGYLLPNVEHIIAMYVRKEALLSSQIEGTEASLEDLFEYENETQMENLADVQEVVNYIKALKYGLEQIADSPLTLSLIQKMHSILLSGTRGKEKTPGKFRQVQNWIGPVGCKLETASFVPPPPKEALKAMERVEEFWNEHDELPILIACALIHYQFETIHPFLDGNGRLGRLLISLYLYTKRTLQKPLLYLSYYFKMHRQEYYDRLNLVRRSGDYEQWIVFFLKGIAWTAGSALDTVKTILQMAEMHKKKLIQHKISSPLAISLLDFLFEKPHISVHEIAERFRVSPQTAHGLVNQFVQANLLREVTGKKRRRRFSYWEYLNCLAEGTTPWPGR